MEHLVTGILIVVIGLFMFEVAWANRRAWSTPATRKYFLIVNAAIALCMAAVGVYVIVQG